jgi:hypothetical protein
MRTIGAALPDESTRPRVALISHGSIRLATLM